MSCMVVVCVLCVLTLQLKGFKALHSVVVIRLLVRQLQLLSRAQQQRTPQNFREKINK